MENQNINFLVIGGGSIGKRHIKNLHYLGYSNIFCLRREKDRLFDKKNRVQTVTSIKDINVPVNVVIVCTPTSLHRQGIEIAKTFNASIFMEKPLSYSKDDLEAINKVIEGYNQVFFIGFMLRYHPFVKKIKSIIQEKQNGEVYSARFEFGSYLPYWHPWEDYKQSYASKKALGGGVVNTISHELDLIQYLFGNPCSIKCIKANYEKLNIEVEEIAEAIFEYPDKLISLHLDYLQKDYDRRIRILCDEGSLEWNWHENKIILKNHEKESEIFTLSSFDINQLYIDELSEFIELIKHKRIEHSLDYKHAKENMQLILMMHEN